MKKKKSKFYAVTLSLICPGLGHLYLGRWLKGLLFIAVALISLWGMSEPVRIAWEFYSAVFSDPSVLLNGKGLDVDLNMLSVLRRVFLWGVLFTLVFFWALVESFLIARKSQKGSQSSEGQ